MLVDDGNSVIASSLFVEAYKLVFFLLIFCMLCFLLLLEAMAAMYKKIDLFLLLNALTHWQICFWNT